MRKICGHDAKGVNAICGLDPGHWGEHGRPIELPTPAETMAWATAKPETREQLEQRIRAEEREKVYEECAKLAEKWIVRGVACSDLAAEYRLAARTNRILRGGQ
jgi:hypothetical protein